MRKKHLRSFNIAFYVLIENMRNIKALIIEKVLDIVYAQKALYSGIV